jgi:hypothetical protein
MSTWPKGLTFLEPKSTPHEVGGKKLNFYPMSIGLAFKLKSIGKPLGAALSVLFTNDKNDAGTKIRLVANEHGTQDSEQIGEPISPELAALRLKQKSDAISNLIDAITADSTQELLGTVIMDSLRDQFKDSRPSTEEFVTNVHMPQLVEMLIGVAKANKGVFGPLTGEFETALDKARKAVGDKLGATSPAVSNSPSAQVSNVASPEIPATTSDSTSG